MRKSFYTWLMTERNPKSNAPKAILADLAFHEDSNWDSTWSNCPKAILADLAFHESAFPKHTDDFDEVSRYLEEHASFSFNLGDFDAIWEEYQAH